MQESEKRKLLYFIVFLVKFCGFFQITMCEAVRLARVSEKPVNSDEAPAGLLTGISPAPVVKQNFLCTRLSPWLSGQLPPWRGGLKSSLKSLSWVEQCRQLPRTAPFYHMHPELHVEQHETWKFGSLTHSFRGAVGSVDKPTYRYVFWVSPMQIVYVDVITCVFCFEKWGESSCFI